MPFETRMFNWHDSEFRHADEVYLAVIIALTLIMIIGFLTFNF